MLKIYLQEFPTETSPEEETKETPAGEEKTEEEMTPKEKEEYEEVREEMKEFFPHEEIPTEEETALG